MPVYTQAERPLSLVTPLGDDALLLTGLAGQDGISRLFSFHLDLLAELQTKVHFDRVMGQNITVTLQPPDREARYFNGLVKRFTQCGRDQEFQRFRAEIVPQQWLLTKKARSRIFQHLTVPDILRQVLTGLNVEYKLGLYQPREYCVQYRESDFDFISRLMEEEGMFYFFKHGEGFHQMTISDMANQHPYVAGQRAVTYDELAGGLRDEMRITRWEKTQELRSGECTLWDHCFQLPGKHLGAARKTIPTVVAGKATHKLKMAANDRLEIYDYPGGYAHRFDGVNQNGADQKRSLHEIFLDNERTVKIRMEQEEVGALQIEGESDCSGFSAGHQFKLEGHFDADDSYLLTGVEHKARLEGDYRSSDALDFHYENRFQCMPVSVRFRPQRVTEKPVIPGCQTATVVGPPGEEIYCDKYGRVKVQFHWDREGKKDAGSSCWLRVAQIWAGKGWGAFFWPRIGHEVVVVFEEGDPDQPLIAGSLYNAENVPPFLLPQMKDFAGIKSATVHGAPTKDYSGIVFVDRKGEEHLAIHSERHLVMNAEFDRSFTSGRHQGERVPMGRTLTVGRLPGMGGGSGGGPNRATFTPFEPQGLLGLNSTVVYGTNAQIACPLNFQVAVGSNLQLCINPSAWTTLYGDGAGQTMPGSLTDLLGAGLGGNMQMTMGTSANFVMGQVYDINLGPRRITLDLHNKTAIQPACEYLGTWMLATSGVFLLAYGFAEDDDARTWIVAGYQILVQEIIAALMDVQGIYHAMDRDYKKALDKTFTALPDCTDPDDLKAKDGAFDAALVSSYSYEGAITLTAIVTSMILPLVLDIAGEGKLDSEPATETYQVTDSSGNDIGQVTIPS